MTQLANPGTGAARWPVFDLGGAVALFTNRAGGSSWSPYNTANLSTAVGDQPGNVSRNRDLLTARCGDGRQPVRWMQQVHGAVVREAEPAPAAGDLPGTDALFTRVPGLPVGVLTADCAPVLIADGRAGVAGAAHAGRAGLAAGVVPALIAAMTRAGGQAPQMSAVIGPMICGACYEVPAELRDEVAAAVPGTGCTTRWATPGIDIRAGVLAQLEAAGVGQVTSDARCTAESRELYSYRRDGTTGRFAGVIWLSPSRVTRRDVRASSGQEATNERH